MSELLYKIIDSISSYPGLDTSIGLCRILCVLVIHLTPKVL